MDKYKYYMIYSDNGVDKLCFTRELIDFFILDNYKRHFPDKMVGIEICHELNGTIQVPVSKLTDHGVWRNTK